MSGTEFSHDDGNHTYVPDPPPTTKLTLLGEAYFGYLNDDFRHTPYFTFVTGGAKNVRAKTLPRNR